MASSVTSLTRASSFERFNGRGTDKKVFFVYCQCYFVTIATILGTGVLGLPVTLSRSGLYPFFVSFLGGFFMQALLIYLFTDLLQRAHGAQLQNAKDAHHSAESMPLNYLEAEEEDLEDLEDEHESNGSVLAGHVIIPREVGVLPPNLHLLGELFLPCIVRQLFDVVLMIQFIALLISYALAGSMAYAQVLRIEDYLVYVIPVFVWVLTFVIVYAMSFIQPVVSLLTIAKGSLLLATVVITFFVGSTISHEVTNDFSEMGQSFLMGTVALGGVVNVMPFLYGKIQPIPAQVRGFRTAVLAGLTTCTILNVLWCWSVLDIVPQRNTCFTYEVSENNTYHFVHPHQYEHQTICSHNLSLESSAANGEISTIPLTKIISSLYPQYDWVGLLVQLFIMISITVSYLTIGAAMSHTLNGAVDSLWSQDRVSSYTSKINKVASRCEWFSAKRCCRDLFSLSLFAVVFVIVMMNPKAFEVMLEKASSFFINIEAAVFIFWMLCNSTSGDYSNLTVPLPLSNSSYWLRLLLPIYFGFALIYDVYLVAHDMIRPPAAVTWLSDIQKEHVLVDPVDYLNQSTTADVIEYLSSTITSIATASNFSTVSTIMTPLTGT